MFQFLKTKLQKIHNSVTSQLQGFFSRETVDESALQELERILITADTGVSTSKEIIETLKKSLPSGAKGSECKQILGEQLLALIGQKEYCAEAPVLLLVGINGSGKTTCSGKLAHSYAQQGKKVLLVAADTFRAAAANQLQEWAQRAGVAILMGKDEQDPASLIFEACTKFTSEGYDHLIIDTAGRLQTKTNLMKELEKLNRVLKKQLPTATTKTLLTIDAMLGQNSLEQAKLFHEVTPLDGIILTKMDGTGKGGIVFAISKLLGTPIAYMSYGEKIEDLKLFNAQEYIHQLLEL
jgi:fused signal recognition particle receptor